MATVTAFLQRVEKLNPEQRTAVDAIDGPVMVIAGPGTGKTEILTLRIANILHKTDTPPEAILALTFTESAAGTMRRRLADLIGAAAYRVRVTTFHGFCNDVIQRYPEYFPDIIDSMPATAVDQIKIMERVIASAAIAELRPFGDPKFYVMPVIRAIEQLKREGVDPDSFDRLTADEERAFSQIDDLCYDSGPHKGKMKGKYQDAQKHIIRNRELVTVYRGYQAALQKEKKYDFSDMIMTVAEVMRNDEGLSLMLREQHQYILVDEHQDTNNAQNAVLELLAGDDDHPNLFIVGDDKQAIFRFQGASLENFAYLQKKFPSARRIELTQNYRSTDDILSLAGDFMGRGRLRAATAGRGSIEVFSTGTPESERYLIATDIRDALAGGERPDEIAVIYRENKEADPLARMLGIVGIPFAVESSADILNDPWVRLAIRLMEAVADFGNPVPLMAALAAGAFNVPPLDVYKISDAARTGRQNPYDLIRNPEVLREIQVENPNALARAYALLSSWAQSAAHSPLETLSAIIRDSGILDHVLNEHGEKRSLDRLRAFLDHLKESVSSNHTVNFADFIDHIARIKEHGVLIPFASGREESGKVHLMTAHGAKGREFERVYITNAVDGHWGNRRRREHLRLPAAVYQRLEKAESALNGENTNAATSDDERNLFFVALTRAKKHIAVTYARKTSEGRESVPSQFIAELKPELAKSGNGEKYEKEFTARQDIIFAFSGLISTGAYDAGGQYSASPTDKEKQFLNDLFESQGLSVTALNNYLECPWKYFYANLIRIPQAPTLPLCYGRAVHAALKKYLDRWTRGDATDEKFLLAAFRHALEREPLSGHDLKSGLKKGEAVLPGYVQKTISESPRNLLNEFRIDPVPLAGITITGILDRIEIIGSGNRVTVVDYKTGKPKTRNEIEGKTKSSDGNYKRQLVFYNLLLDEFENGRFTMASGRIDFIEPDPKGKYRSEPFEITKEEKESLKEQIATLADEIRELKFWNTFCDEKGCEYCELRRGFI